ncbi:MAG: D-alanyl-D-alanine carboxypeptidase family protein [Myxococcota bacterium]
MIELTSRARAVFSGALAFFLPFLLMAMLMSMLLACTSPPEHGAVDPLEDSLRQRAMIDGIAVALAGPMKRRTPEQALLVGLEELYAPLTLAERDFMEAIRALPGGDPGRGVVTDLDWVRIEDQRVRSADGERTMPLQLLPHNVWQAYQSMSEAMKTDLGRSLVIGSGYRSPANQLFIFVSYMPYHGYSVKKTLPHVSVPGASDHNRPERQGIDFVSQDGVDLRYSDAPAFEALDEYRWLLENAARFGFVNDEPSGVSPWHWHFSGERSPP